MFVTEAKKPFLSSLPSNPHLLSRGNHSLLGEGWNFYLLKFTYEVFKVFLLDFLIISNLVEQKCFD